MADTIKYVSSENLKYYDGKIKSYLEGKDAALQSALEGQIDIVAQAVTAEESRAKAAEQANATAAQNAQTAADNAQTAVDTLAEKVGEVEDGKTVMGIIAQIQAEAYDDTEVRGLISDLDENKLDKTQHDTDKQALEGAIALKADQTALDSVSEVANAAATKTALQEEVNRATGEEARIEGLVTTEKNRAEGIEAGLRTDVDDIKADYLKGADKTELQGNIDELSEALELLTNGVSAEEVDGVNDLIQYVKDHGTEVTGMKADIEANADAIAEHVAIDHDFAAADTALKNELNAEIAKKADATTVEAMDAAYKKADQDLETALKKYADDEDAKIEARVEALEEDTHTHSNKALLDTYTQTEENLADAVAKKHEHENKSVLDGITAGKVSAWDSAEQNAKNHADGLNSAMTTRVDQLVETVGTKAAQTDLNDAVARIGAEETKSANFETRIAANEAFIAGIEFMSESDINGLFA